MIKDCQPILTENRTPMKPQKPVTRQRLKNVALFYLSKYESSTENLRRVLKRRVLKARLSGADVPEDVNAWIEEIVASVVAAGYVDDKRFAQNLVEKYKAAGKSVKFIAQKLKNAGVEANVGDIAEIDEREAANRLVRKKKLGPFRPPEKRKEFFKKDLAVLARAGFSFDVARGALEQTIDDDGEEHDIRFGDF